MLWLDMQQSNRQLLGTQETAFYLSIVIPPLDNNTNVCYNNW